jgi:hypothetical protein
MANKAFISLLNGFNAQIKSLNENNLKIFDSENPEFFITEVEYDRDLDKLIFKTSEDPNELSRMDYLKKANAPV